MGGALYQIFLLKGRTCESVPFSACGNSKADLCPSADHGLPGAGLCRRHARSFPPKPLHFLERKTKCDLPGAETMYTAACCFFHLPKGRTCPTVPAPLLSPNQRFTWTAQTAPAAGSRTKGWHCRASPKREELDYSLFSSFSLLVSVSVVRRHHLLSRGAPVGASGLWAGRLMKALQRQDTCI